MGGSRSPDGRLCRCVRRRSQDLLLHFASACCARAQRPQDELRSGRGTLPCAGILRDDRIVYYVSPTQINFYQHHRWGSDPATLLSEFTAQWVDSSGVFTQVRMLPVRERVDYTLGGSVLSFEEVDSDGGAKVRLALALSLVRTSDHKLVWSGEQRQETPLRGARR